MVIAGVIRLTETSRRWEEASLEGAGVQGFGGACMMRPSGLGSALGLEGEVGVESVGKGGVGGQV